MNYLKITIGILLALSASRFIPHPPNFTSLLALSFYIPALFGLKFIPAVVISLIFTDAIIGFHSTMFFTTGSIIFIGFIAQYLKGNILTRIFGASLGAVIFFIVTNFGVWLGGSYGFTFGGMINCYLLALPFFGYTLISTLMFSVIIESAHRLYQNKLINI